MAGGRYSGKTNVMPVYALSYSLPGPKSRRNLRLLIRHDVAVVRRQIESDISWRVTTWLQAKDKLQVPLRYI